MELTLPHKLVFFVLTIIIFISALFQSNAEIWPVILSSTASLLFFLLFSNSEGLGKVKLGVALLTALFVYSVVISIYPLRSILVVTTTFGNFLVFATFFSIYSQDAVDGTDSKIENSNSLILLVVIALAISVTLHSIVLISQYLDFPVRVTGLLKDYSQAAMLILLLFGLVYPRIRDHKLATPFSFLLFLGFFSTFSRSANFLLILFLLVVIIAEYKKDSFKRSLEIISSIGIAGLVIYLFPLLVRLQPVDRGGVAHIQTLNSRTYYWQSAWNAIRDNPFFGYGFETYEFTGIKTLVPQHKIHLVHNDYLQIWHDLGLVWLCAFLAGTIYILVKFSPTKYFWNPLQVFTSIRNSKLEPILCWWLLVLVSLYMTINFLILSSIFQLIIYLLVIILLYHMKQRSQANA